MSNFSKDLKALFKRARKQGWTRDQCSGHSQWFSPCGQHILTVSSSPSDINAIRQIKRQLKRLGYQV